MLGIATALLLCAGRVATAAEGPGDQNSGQIDGGAYLDLGYLDSSTRPGNHT